MSEHFNRVLLSLLAQASPEFGPSGTDELERRRAAGLSARQEALQCLLLERRGAGGGQTFSVRREIRNTLEQCRAQVSDRVPHTATLAEGEDTLFGDPDALRELVTLAFAQGQHRLRGRSGRLSFTLEHVDGPSSAVGLGPGTHARLRVGVHPRGNVPCEFVSPLDGLFQGSLCTGSRLGWGESWSPGLSLAHNAAWALGGVLYPGGVGDGALFTVWLPIDGKRERPAVAPHCAPRLGLAVLYVSGDEEILSMGHSSLIESDCWVHVACNGADALRNPALHAGEIDLVVAEEHLGDMSGAGLVGELNRHHPGISTLIAAPDGRRSPDGRRGEDLRDVILTPFSAGEIRHAAWSAAVPKRRQGFGLA